MDSNPTPSPETNNQNTPSAPVTDPKYPFDPASVNSPFGQPMQPQQPPNNSKNSNLPLLIIIGASLLVIVVIVIYFLIATHNKNSPGYVAKGQSQLQPTLPGDTQCGVGAEYAQVAVSGGADCNTANTVAGAAKGTNYTSNGYSCTATKQGSNTKWSSFWSGTFYSYYCSDGSKQIAFNWQSTSVQSTNTNTTTTTPSSSSPTTVTIGGSGALQPTLPGDGQCDASTNYAQIAISGGADCTTATSVVQAANGSNFSSNGYSCAVTKESSSSNTQWSSYWNGDFYAYTCSDGSKQIAFNWQSSTAAQ